MHTSSCVCDPARSQMEELRAEAEQRAQAEAAKAREERVELIRRRSARRLLSTDLSRGWTAWHDMWTARG